MKFFKSTFVIVALIIIGSVNAKQIGKKTTTTPQTEPSFAKATEGRQQMEQVQPSGKTQPTKAKTFEQLFNEVKNAKNAWDSKKQLLNEIFVEDLAENAIKAKIGRNNLGLLLNVARDYHAQFTGPKTDIDILKALEDQKNEALRYYDISVRF